MGRSPLVTDSSDGNAGGAERLRATVLAVGRHNDGAKRSGRFGEEIAEIRDFLFWVAGQIAGSRLPLPNLPGLPGT
ncbi:hypothetical protein CRG98_035975, partial [Punica granatum]